MSNLRIRRSGRTPTKSSHKLLLNDDTLSTSSEDDDSTHLSSDEDWEPSHYEEPLIVTQSISDGEFDGPVEDPLALDFHELPDSKHGDIRSNSPVRINVKIIKEDDLDLVSAVGCSSTKGISVIDNAGQKPTRTKRQKKQHILRDIDETNPEVIDSEEKTQAVIIKHEVEEEGIGKQNSTTNQRKARNKRNQTSKNNRRPQTEAQYQRRLELQRLRRKRATEEERKIELEKRRNRHRKANESAEVRQKKAERARIRRKHLTDEQRQRSSELQRLRRQIAKDKMNEVQNELQKELEQQVTDKEREEKLAKLKELEETHFQQNMKQYLARQAYLSTLTPEERKKQTRKQRIITRIKRMNETPEERQERLDKSRERYRQKRLNWTPEQHEQHREWVRNWSKMKAEQKPYREYSAEKRERLLSYQKERLKRETPEQREYRLARYKRNIEKRKLLNKMQEDGMSKEDAENALQISRPDLYPARLRSHKPYVPRVKKQLPPPGRKSNVTPEEIAEVLNELKSGKLRHGGHGRARQNTTSVSKGENSGSGTSESNNVFPTIIKSNKNSAPVSLFVEPSGKPNVQSSLNECPAEFDLKQSEILSEKEVRVDEITRDNIKISESDEEHISSPVGSPIRGASDHDNDTINEYDNEDGDFEQSAGILSGKEAIVDEVTRDNIKTESDDEHNFSPVGSPIGGANDSDDDTDSNKDANEDADFQQAETLSGKKARVVEIAKENTTESDEEHISSPIGSPMGEVNDSDNDTDNNKDDKEDADIAYDKNASRDSDLQSLNTVVKDEPANDAQKASSTSQENTSQNKGVKHTCEKCGKSYSITKLFKQHMEAHKNENRKSFRCPRPSCGKEFSHSAYVLSHFRKMHGGKSASCNQPKKPRIARSTIAKKETKKDITNASICSYCGKKFDAPSLLARHVYNVHEYNPKEGGFMCQYCSKVFKSKCYLDGHIRRVHLGMDNKCDVCRRSFQSLTKLWKHKVDAHDMKDLDPSSISSKMRILQCEYCGLNMFRGLKAHVEKQHPERFEEFLNPKTQISNSSYGYTDRLAKKRHYWHTVGKFKKMKSKLLKATSGNANAQQARTSEESIACTICNKLLRPDSFRRHMERIHPNPNDSVSCDKCQKLCPTEAALVRHILFRHPGLAKFKIYGIVVDAGGEEGKGKTKEKQILCQFCRTPQDDNFMYRVHLYDTHAKDIIQNFKDGIAEEQANPPTSLPCPYCDVIIRTTDSGLLQHIRKKHYGKCWDEFRAGLKKNKAPRKPRPSRRKPRRKVIKVAKKCNRSDDDINEDTNNQDDYCAKATRKSARHKRPPRRYVYEQLSDSEFSKLKKVKVPRSPAKFTLEEQRLFEKHQDVKIKWKGNPVVVLEPLNNTKT
ncbi:unnamed protein product [Orchesella dallaii]|uniref:Zinc finger protein n=1 Tax=Orchesella dallaii TaxID=48710 RepID=A0ABP1S635_9HEXA